MEQLINSIASNGVTGCVLAYFMVVINTTLKENTKATQELKEAIIELKLTKENNN